MSVLVKKLNDANAIITAIYDQAAICKAEDRAAANLAKSADIKGFRKGKVPVAVIKERFKSDLRNEAMSHLANAAFEEGLKTIDKNNVVGAPIVSKADEKDGALSLELKVSLRPRFDLGDYQALIPAAQFVEVLDKELNDMLERAADSVTPLEEIKEDRALANGDIANFDFKGSIDGKEARGASAEKYDLKIGSKSFIPGFEDQMLGMKKSETKEFAVTFPKDYHAADFAGKDVKFVVKLNAIKMKTKAEITDEIAKKLLPNVKDANAQKLREYMTNTLREEKKAKLYNEELRPQALEALVKKYDFDLPEVILEQEIDHLAGQKAGLMSNEELNALKSDEKALKALREEFREEAKERVKTTFIIDAIAKKEDVKVSDQEVAQAIYYQALQTGQDPKSLLDYYRANNLFAVIRMSLMEDRVLTKLLDMKAGGEAQGNVSETQGNVSEAKPKKSAKKKEAE